MEPFEDIDCMTIERFYCNFTKSKGDPQFRVVTLGPWSVNIKDFIKFQTTQPGNFMMYRKIYRGQTHIRKRPDSLKNSRFTVGLEFDSLTKRSVSDADYNWLGREWQWNHNNFLNPTLNQIERGLVAEAIVQIQLAMGKISNQQDIIDAKANIKKTWEELLSEARVPDRDKILDINELYNPYHPVTMVCLFIYQFQSFAFSELNRACRFKD